MSTDARAEPVAEGIETPLRLCVLADQHIYRWEVEALEHALEADAATLSLLVVEQPADGPDTVQKRGARSTANPGRLGLDELLLFGRILRRERAWALVLAERKLGWIIDPPNPLYDSTSHVDDVDCFADVERIDCTAETDGVWNELPDSVVDQIATEADVIVRFGFGLLHGDVLSATPHGVLSYHPADIRKYRGLGPSRQWLEDDPVAGTTLQRLDDSIDGGEIVVDADVATIDAATLHEVENRIYERQVQMLVTGLCRVADPTFSPTTVDADDLGVYTPITRRRDLDYAGGILRRNVGGRLLRSARRLAQPLRLWAGRQAPDAQRE